MDTKQPSALVWRTRSMPALFKHSATSVLGREQTASPDGSTPACMATQQLNSEVSQSNA